MKQATHFVVYGGWKILLLDLGINPADVLALAGLPGDLFAREGATLSTGQYFALWHALEELAGADELPLKIGQAISAESFSPPIFACLCSPNLKKALQRLAQYKPLIGPIIFEVETGKQETVVTISCYGHAGSIPRSLGAMELVFLTRLARLATRENITPCRLELPHPPKKRERYEEFFRRRIRKGEQIRIAFAEPDASRPFLTADAGMWEFFEADLKKRLSDLETGTSTTRKVKSVLLEMLPSGQISIDEAARRLAMSTRSLQRHLKGESSNYQEILNQTRRELAQHYLGKSVIPPGEISYLLGYRDSNSFIRAFKSWTGVTPGEYRRPGPADQGSGH